MIPLPELKEALHLDAGDASQDQYLVQCEAAAVAHIEHDLGWRFSVPEQRIEILDGTGLDTIWLAEAPLPADAGVDPPITAAVIEERIAGVWTVVNAEEYELDGRAVYREAGWSEGRRNIRATYWQGYPAGAEPTDVRQAVLLLVGHWFENREAGVVGTVTSEIRQGVAELLRAFPRRVRL